MKKQIEIKKLYKELTDYYEFERKGIILSELSNIHIEKVFDDLYNKGYMTLKQFEECTGIFNEIMRLEGDYDHYEKGDE